MSNPLYLELQALGKELLQEFGRDLVFNRYQRNTADLVEGTVGKVLVASATIVAAVVPASGGTLEAFDVRFMDGVADATDLRFAICSAVKKDGTPIGFVPEPGDEAVFDGRTWAVMGNTPVNVDGTPVIYSVGFRGA